MAEQRAVIPFPNYLQIRERSWLPLNAWHWLRGLSLLVALGIAALAWTKPKLGLALFWSLAVPILPAVFFIAPGLWRNLCPLAAANQTPRLLGFTRGLTVPDWLRRYGYVIGIATLFVAVTARKFLFNQSGEATALLIIVALVLPFIGGLFFKGKSGWCSLVCPVLPVERLYNETPFVLVANSHCTPCVGCTKNCYDFNPRAANLADAYDDDAQWAGFRRFLAAVFPGFLLAYFQLPNPPAIAVGQMYLGFALYLAASAGAFFALATFLRLPSARLPALFGVLALNIFYWYVLPTWFASAATLAGANAAPALAWAGSGALASLSLWWLARTRQKEQDYLRERQGATELKLPAGAVSALRKAGQAAVAEVVFQPQDVRTATEPGRSLLEIAEAQQLPIEAGCRMGMCGADPVVILEGGENLSPRTPDEQATLERLGLAGNPAARLACMCRVQGAVTVSLGRASAGAASAPATPAKARAQPDPAVKSIVIVGNGIAGVTSADYARRLHPDCEIHLIGAEKHALYNRMAITRLIYGRSAMGGLYLNPDSWYEERRITTWLNTSVSAAARGSRQLVLATGETLAFDRLILACGSSSFVPDLPGYGLPGSFGLRDADEAMTIRRYVQDKACRRAVVAGGGLLGLEAAYALHKLGLRVTVLERGPWLLRRQLDQAAAGLLAQYLQGLGMDLMFEAQIAALEGERRVRAARLKDGSTLACDLFLICTGIAPNVDLAKSMGLAVKRGVVVDPQMRTSDPSILAAGDCCEFEGRLPGLWPTAVDQGRIAGGNAAGGSDSYVEQAPVTALKVVGVDVTSVGRFEPAPGDEVIIAEDEAGRSYRKLVMSQGRLAGAILIGDSGWVPGVTRAVKSGDDLSPVMDRLRRGEKEALDA